MAWSYTEPGQPLEGVEEAVAMVVEMAVAEAAVVVGAAAEGGVIGAAGVSKKGTTVWEWS